jgi:hypothetical protein
MKLSQLLFDEIPIGFPVYSALGTWGSVAAKGSTKSADDFWIHIKWTNHNDSVLHIKEAEFIEC